MTMWRWVSVVASAMIAWLLVLAVRRRASGASARFFEHPGASLGLGWLIFVCLAALFAPILAPYAPASQLDIVRLANATPSPTHPFGTDMFSRDIWTRLLYGARVSLLVAGLAVVVAITAGGLVGAVAGYFRRGVDTVLMRAVDVGLAVPRIFIVLIAIALTDHLALGPLILILGLTGWFATSRMVRAEVLTIRTRDYVGAARALGAGPWRILGGHVLPNAASPLIVSAMLGIGNVMLLEAALSFLGVGVQPPTPSWGNMIADGRDQLATAPWITVAPGLALAFVVMAVNVVGDGLREAWTPRSL